MVLPGSWENASLNWSISTVNINVHLIPGHNFIYYGGGGGCSNCLRALHEAVLVMDCIGWCKA